MAAQSSSAKPKPLITAEINDQLTTRLVGNTHPFATPENDRGALPPSKTLQRMLLVLRRSPAQDKALAEAIQAMHQPASPTFHHWLTPQEIGEKYGPAKADIDRVTAWLSSRGFTVTSISKAHTTIEFSGSVQAFSSAFHTEMHSFAHRDGLYSANVSDPAIPSALAPVVAGFASLNNFPRVHFSQQPRAVKYDKQAKKWLIAKPASGTGKNSGAAPQFTTVYDNTTFYPVTPADFATIYNLNPLYKDGIDGTGQTIAIVSESNIKRDDIDLFRKVFGLPPTKLNIILNGPDPGETLADGGEPSLDAEWSGAIAKNATIDFVVSKTTDTSAGIDLSAQYIIDNQVAPVLSESYGYCELGLGAAGNLFYYQLWQQAAAQGITAVLAAGDSGAATCDQNYPAATYGDSVSGFASTPYTVTVGGTDFEVSATNPTPYWSDTNDPATLASALSYIPEVPWNSSCASPNINGAFAGSFGASTPEDLCNNKTAQQYFLYAVGGGGGASNCVTTDPNNPLQCTGGYPQPVWQNNINGIADNKSRYLPDVSLFAANGAFGSMYLYCASDFTPTGVCDYSDPESVLYLGSGGTSFAAPAFAGIMALVNQKTNSSQGLANYVLYDLGRKQYGTNAAPNTSQTNACNSSTAPADNACTFYDVTVGSNAEPCYTGSTGCVTDNPADQIGILPGYDSNSGFDAVTGLGTINATNLVNNWGQISQTGTSTTLAVSPAHITYGNTVTASGSVTAASGTPTGEVILQADQLSFGSMPLVSGSYSQSVSILPAGAYTAIASYLGDGSFSKSTSSPVSLVVDKAPSSGTLAFTAVDPFNHLPVSSTNSIPYGSQIVGTFTAQGVSGVPGIAAPTGTVTFSQGASSIGQNDLNNGTATAFAIAGVVGNASWTANYGGDSNYLPSAPVNGSYTVVKASTTLESHPNVSVVTGSNSVTLSATVSSLSYAAPPMGTVSFFINGTAVGSTSVIPGVDPVTAAGMATASLAVQASQLKAGTNVITASYSGNGNFSGSQSTQTSLLYSASALSSAVSLTASTNSTSNTVPVTLSAAVTLSGSPAPVGLVSFMDGTRLLARVPVVGINPAAGAATGTAKLVILLPLGTHNITATYAGISGAIPAATSSAASITVTGTLPTATTLSAKTNSLLPANYDLTALVYAGGTTVPTGTVTVNEPSTGGTLGQITLDPTTVSKGLAPEEQLGVGGTPQEVKTGDFNGDGILDLAVSRDFSLDNVGDFGLGQPQLEIFLGKGDGTFAKPLTMVITMDPNIAGPQGIEVGDFNGDGIQDIVFVFSFGGNITTLLGKGDGTFNIGPALSVPGAFPTLNNVTVDDFNGDGLLDIAFADLGDSSFDVALGNGDGSFQSPQLIQSLAPSRIQAADVDKDGKPDLVVLHPFANTVNIALGKGDGTFQDEAAYATNADTPWGFALGDVNKDGYLDIVTANQGDSTVAVLLNNGDGTYGSAITYSVGFFPQSVAVGDINHDGVADIIAANNGGNSLTILYGKGDGTFTTGETVKTGAAPVVPFLTDLNNDGLADIVVNENQNGTTGVFLSGTTLSGKITNIAVDGAVTEKQTLTATYAGDTTYSASTSPAISLAGSGALTPTHINWTPAVNSDVFGTAIPAGLFNATAASQDNATVTGTITYATFVPGGGSMPLTASAILPAAGTYTITATFTPDNTADYASSTAQVTFTVNKAGVKQTLTASSSTVAPGSPLTLTDIVTSATTGTPTGVVNFFAGSNSIGAATLDSTGKATLTTSSLPAGSASITASYLGDGNFTSDTSAPTSITVGAPGFLLSLAAPNLNVTAGSSAKIDLNIAASLGYTGNVNLSCGNTPPGMSCAFAPASGTLSGTALQSTLTLTSAGSSNTASNQPAQSPWLALGGGATLACLLFLGAPGRSNRRLRGMLIVVLCTGLTAVAIGCGGSSSSSTATLSLTSSSTKASTGSSVTFKAAVGGKHGSSATGTVTFYDGATALGSPAQVSGGAASITVPSLSVGTHTITASYSGDTKNSAAPSNALQQVITGQTMIQIVAVSGTVTQTANLNVTLQ